MMMFGFQQNQLFKLISRAQLLRKVWKMQLSSAAPNFARGFLLNKYQEIFATTSMPNLKKVVWQKKEQFQKGSAICAKKFATHKSKQLQC